MGAATELLRRREDPQQATFLELFFDLAYVFAFTRVSQLLVADLTLDDDGAADWRLALADAGKTLLLLLALFWVWSLTVAMTSGFAPRRPTMQVLIVATMFASMVMGVALHGAFDQRGLAFAGAYVAIQVGRPLFLGVVLRGHWLRRGVRRALLWSVVSAGRSGASPIRAMAAVSHLRTGGGHRVRLAIVTIALVAVTKAVGSRFRWCSSAIAGRRPPGRR